MKWKYKINYSVTGVKGASSKKELEKFINSTPGIKIHGATRSSGSYLESLRIDKTKRGYMRIEDHHGSKS